MAHLLANDEAVDVRNTITSIDLDHLENNDTVPYEIKVEKTAKRGITPSDLVPDHAPDRPKSADEQVDDDPPISPSAKSSGGKSPTPRFNIDINEASSSTRTLPASPSRKQKMTRAPSFHHQIRIDRRPSAEMVNTMDKMQLDPNLLTPTTPGTDARARRKIAERLRREELGDGHYHSSPSPNEPSGGMDPFAMSFGEATPEGSPNVSMRSLESPQSERGGRSPSSA